MPELFEVKLEESTFRLHYAEPAFEIFRDYPPLVSQLFRRLQRYGLGVQTIQFEHADDDLGKVHLRLFLPSSGAPNASVRIYIDRIEIWTTAPSGYDELIGEVVSAVAAHIPTVTYTSFHASTALHGIVQAPIDFLSRFSGSAPKILGPPNGSGVVFYYGPDQGRLTSSLTLDLSAVQSGGIFFQVAGLLDGSYYEPGSLWSAWFGQVRSILSELGLRLQEEVLDVR